MAASLRPTILWSAARRLRRQGSFSPGPGILQLQHTAQGHKGTWTQNTEQRGVSVHVHSTQRQSPCTRVHKGSFVLGADPGQKLVSMQSSILSPLPRAARALPPLSPALFTPATVAESQRSAGGGWRVLGAGGNATLLLNLDTGAALSPAAVLGLDTGFRATGSSYTISVSLSSIVVNW